LFGCLAGDGEIFAERIGSGGPSAEGRGGCAEDEAEEGEK
jgi:hypothetical protein